VISIVKISVGINDIGLHTPMAPASERREESRTSLTSQTQHAMQGRLLLDIVVGERLAVLELLAGEDQALLVWRNALGALDRSLDFLDGVVLVDIESRGLTSEKLDKDLHHDERERERDWIGLDWVWRRAERQNSEAATRRMEAEVGAGSKKKLRNEAGTLTLTLSLRCLLSHHDHRDDDGPIHQSINRWRPRHCNE